jgi:glycosyltransferase involved in cell wall biosynthesis
VKRCARLRHRDDWRVEGLAMAASTPRVSVTVLAYNHEKYIGEALRSILGQTLTDLEAVVVDDGSTDSTFQVISSFRDPRLISIRQNNQGPSAAANRALQGCRGRYIALMSGDDVCHPDRLQRQFDAYQRGSRRLLFSAVDFIDDCGQPLADSSFCEGVFDTQPRMRAEIYHRFFHRGNFINALTCFTETDVLRQFGYCDPLLLQLQDYDLWIRLVKHYDFQFLQEPTLHYRIRGNGQNLSAPAPRQSLRCLNELYFILRRFFENVDPPFFREAFRAELLHPECKTSTEIACEQAFLFLRAGSSIHRLLGVEKLHELLRDPDSAEVLRARYGFDARAFMKLLGAIEPFNPLHDGRSTLYLDLGNGFNEEAAFRTAVDFSTSHFALTFEVTDAACVRQLRWDPCEGRLCRVRIDEMTWQTPKGRKGTIDLSALAANGVRDESGTYTFETTDPMFLIPCTETVARFTIRGCWEVDTLETSLGRFPALMAERDVLRRELAAQGAERVTLDRKLQAILASRRWRLANKAHSLWRFLRGNRAA